MSQTYENIRDRLSRGEVIFLDGGVGTEIVRRGARWRNNALPTNPDIVRAVHEDYLNAGVDVLRTNTFQLNRRTFLNLFRDLEHLRHIGAPSLESRAYQLAAKAVELAKGAREAIDRPEVAIAGVVSPLNHCYRPDLAVEGEEARREHREMVAALIEAGVDLLFFDCMNSVKEAKAVLEAAEGFPAWLSFIPDAEGKLLSGEPIAEAVAAVEPLAPEVILLTGAPAEDIERALPELARLWKGHLGACAHIGHYSPPSWKFEFFPSFVNTEQVPPEAYARRVRSWLEAGARVVGGGSGTTPEHIEYLGEHLTFVAARQR